LSLPR